MGSGRTGVVAHPRSCAVAAPSRLVSSGTGARARRRVGRTVGGSGGTEDGHGLRSFLGMRRRGRRGGLRAGSKHPPYPEHSQPEGQHDERPSRLPCAPRVGGRVSWRAAGGSGSRGSSSMSTSGNAPSPRCTPEGCFAGAARPPGAPLPPRTAPIPRARPGRSQDAAPAPSPAAAGPARTTRRAPRARAAGAPRAAWWRWPPATAPTATGC